MIAVFSKCKKAPTIDPNQLFNSLTWEQKDFLNRIGNRFTVSPNLDIFDEPNDQTVANNMTNLKNYIISIPNLYTKYDFEKVYIEIQETERKRNQTDINFEEASFAADSRVILQSGKFVEISELNVGDYVCCGFRNERPIFSEVFLIIYVNSSAMAEFQLINFVKQDGTPGDFENF